MKKDKEYYQYLISLELDDELSGEQKKELDEYLISHPELEKFRDALLEQSGHLRQLPKVKSNSQTPFNYQSTEPTKWLVNLIKYRVNIPLPAAAGILLLFLGSLSLNLDSMRPEGKKPALNLAETKPVQTKYVREIKLKPVQAEIVPSIEEKSNKENSI